MAKETRASRRRAPRPEPSGTGPAPLLRRLHQLVGNQALVTAMRGEGGARGEALRELLVLARSGGSLPDQGIVARLQTAYRAHLSSDPERAADQVADRVVQGESAPVHARAPAAADPRHPLLQRALDPVRSGGRPLSARLQAELGRRLGIDLAGVRIHTDPAAGQAARDVRARAYTVGQHVVFAPGAFQPAVPSGRWLLAHELAHVGQQGEHGAPQLQRKEQPGGAGPMGARLSALPARLRDVEQELRVASGEEHAALREEWASYHREALLLAEWLGVGFGDTPAGLAAVQEAALTEADTLHMLERRFLLDGPGQELDDHLIAMVHEAPQGFRETVVGLYRAAEADLRGSAEARRDDQEREVSALLRRPPRELARDFVHLYEHAPRLEDAARALARTRVADLNPHDPIDAIDTGGAHEPSDLAAQVDVQVHDARSAGDPGDAGALGPVERALEHAYERRFYEALAEQMRIFRVAVEASGHQHGTRADPDLLDDLRRASVGLPVTPDEMVEELRAVYHRYEAVLDAWTAELGWAGRTREAVGLYDLHGEVGQELLALVNLKTLGMVVGFVALLAVLQAVPFGNLVADAIVVAMFGLSLIDVLQGLVILHRFFGRVTETGKFVELYGASRELVGAEQAVVNLLMELLGAAAGGGLRAFGRYRALRHLESLDELASDAWLQEAPSGVREAFVEAQRRARAGEPPLSLEELPGTGAVRGTDVHPLTNTRHFGGAELGGLSPNVLRKMLERLGVRMHGAQLTFLGPSHGVFELTVPSSTGTPLTAQIRLVLTGELPPATTHGRAWAHGSEAGPGRVELQPPGPSEPRWMGRIFVHDRLPRDSVWLVLGHELDEIADLMHRTPRATQAHVDAQMEASLTRAGLSATEATPAVTAHDRAAAAEYFEMFALRHKLLGELEPLRRLPAPKPDQVRRIEVLRRTVADLEAGQRRLRADMGLDEPAHLGAKAQLLRAAAIHEATRARLPKGERGQRVVEAWDAMLHVLHIRAVEPVVRGRQGAFGPGATGASLVRPGVDPNVAAHVLFPEPHGSMPRQNAGVFRKQGIAGGHVDEMLHAFVDNNPEYGYALVEEAKRTDTQSGTVYRLYAQWMYVGGGPTPKPGSSRYPQAGATEAEGWVRADNPKTTADGLDGLLRDAESALYQWTRHASRSEAFDGVGGKAKANIEFNQKLRLRPRFSGYFDYDPTGSTIQERFILRTVYVEGSWIE